MYPDFDGDREAAARASLADHVCYQLRVLDQMGTIALSHCPPVCVCVCMCVCVREEGMLICSMKIISLCIYNSMLRSGLVPRPPPSMGTQDHIANNCNGLEMGQSWDLLFAV